MSPGTQARRLVCFNIVVAVVTGLCLAPVVGTTVARDQTAIVWSEPEELALEPGETAEVEVVFAFEGGDHDGGVESVQLVAQYHPEYLSVTDIDHEPWLAGDGDDADDVDVRTAAAIADENGTAILEQRREPVAGGAHGAGTIATLTIAVPEDAPAATTELSFGATDATFASEWPFPVVDEPATVEIAGGGETVSPDEFDHPDPDEVDLEAEGTDDAAASTRSESAGPTDAVPGFSIGGTLVAGVVAAFVALCHRSGE